MKSYILSPWMLHEAEGGYWDSPFSLTAGLVDLASPVQCAEPSDSSSRGYAVFAVDGLLTDAAASDAGGVLLGQGDARDIKPGLRSRSAWQSMLGFEPIGDSLGAWIFAALTEQSDPTGQDRCLPLVPTTRGVLECRLAGRMHEEKWSMRRSGAYRNRLLSMLRSQFAEMETAEQAGNMRAGQPRRVLDYWREKYGLRGDDWKLLLPESRRDSHPGPLPHETTYSDDFNRTDSASLGANWTDESGDWTIVSNAAVDIGTGSHFQMTFYNSALSSADHYSSCYTTTSSNSSSNSVHGSATRVSSGGSYYLGGAQIQANQYRIFKSASPNTRTLIGSGGSAGLGSRTVKLSSDGSSHQLFADGSSVVGPVTDSTYSSNLFCGMARFPSGDHIFDDFEASDLAVGGGITYTQLENTPRGIQRGIWQRGT